MDDWLKQLQDEFSAATKEAGELLEEVTRETAKETEKAADQLLEVSTSVMDEVDRVIGPAISSWSNQIDDSLEAGFLYLDQHLTPWLEELAAPVTHTVNPWLQNHPTCVGCRNYHGTAYGDQMMVCAMHPYGPETESCRDWESVWPEDSESES